MVKPSVRVERMIGEMSSWVALKVETDKNRLCRGFYRESMEPGELLQDRCNVRAGRILALMEDLEDWSDGADGLRCERGV